MAFNYSPKIITDGLVLCLDAANTKSYPGSGTIWSDLSREGNNGTLTNGPTFNSANGGSIVFDGINDYCDVGVNRNIPIGNQPYTISVWFNSNSFSGNRGFVGWGGYGVQHQVTAFRLLNNGFRNYWWSNDQDSGNLNMIIGQWYNAVALFNGTLRQIWLNGVLLVSGIAFNHNVPYSTNLTVGRTSTNEYFSGRLGPTLIYNKGLTSTEILQNYNATKSRFGL
jgi:hypothetical protein